MKLIKMNEIQAEKVSWLWYPYIPYGKITLVQGAPVTVMALDRAIRNEVDTGGSVYDERGILVF